MMRYKGYTITLSEAKMFDFFGGTATSTTDGLLYKAESEAGLSMASDPDKALQGAIRQIDNKLNG